VVTVKDNRYFCAFCSGLFLKEDAYHWKLALSLSLTVIDHEDGLAKRPARIFRRTRAAPTAVSATTKAGEPDTTAEEPSDASEGDGWGDQSDPRGILPVLLLREAHLRIWGFHDGQRRLR